jgi:hypothetical protein
MSDMSIHGHDSNSIGLDIVGIIQAYYTIGVLL